MSNGDVVDMQILHIGPAYDKDWPAKDGQEARTEKNIDLDVFVYSIQKPGATPEIVNAERKFDPPCKWLSDLMDLSDQLDAAEHKEFAVYGHRLRLVRADKKGKGKFPYGWINVIDMGLSSIPTATVAPAQRPFTPPVPQFTQPEQAVAPWQQPAAVPSSPDPRQYFPAITAAQDDAQLLAAYQQAQGAGLGADPQIIACCSQRKEAILMQWIQRASNPQELVHVQGMITSKSQGDMLSRLQLALNTRAQAFAVHTDIPFTGEDQIPF